MRKVFAGAAVLLFLGAAAVRCGWSTPPRAMTSPALEEIAS
jgi:hypothetical protein